jgi:Ca2+-binding EF-hand superfamily protein
MANFVTDYDEIITCQICSERYDENVRIPMLLCLRNQHTICKECLNKIQKEQDITLKKGISKSKVSTLSCPFCKEEYKINLNEIPKNQTSLKLIRSLKDTTGFSKLIVDENLKTRETESNPQTITPQWDYNNYLKTLFDDVDVDSDGKITKNELHDALIRGQSNSQFDEKTVELLVNMYDTNHDGEISFGEFQNLFSFINEEYGRFLLADEDCSQTIESDELENFIQERGYNIAKNFCTFIVESIKNKTGNGVSFDYFCRIMARFYHLIGSYNFQIGLEESIDDSISLDVYLQNNFFKEFW